MGYVLLTREGVMVSAYDDVYKNPADLQVLIEQLIQAKEQLIENNARNAEEGHKDLWESV